MPRYRVQLAQDVALLLGDLDEKSRRILTDNLRKLQRDPSPGRGPGDKERITVRGVDRYRLHIGRTWTAFYAILEEDRLVRVVELLPIDEAHKRYGP